MDEMLIRKMFAGLLLTIKTNHNIEYKQLAKALDMSVQRVSDYRRERRKISLAVVRHLVNLIENLPLTADEQAMIGVCAGQVMALALLRTDTQRQQDFIKARKEFDHGLTGLLLDNSQFTILKETLEKVQPRVGENASEHIDYVIAPAYSALLLIAGLYIQIENSFRILAYPEGDPRAEEARDAVRQQAATLLPAIRGRITELCSLGVKPINTPSQSNEAQSQTPSQDPS